MKKAVFINWLLATTVSVLMVTLFYLTQKNYNLLTKSNQAIIDTSILITRHQNVSNDFKNALIYISTYKNGPSQAYLNTYGKGVWEKYFDMLQLKRLVGSAEQTQLDTLLKRIDLEEDWLRHSDPNNIQLDDDRDIHMKNVIAIQGFFDNKIARLEHRSIVNVKNGAGYLLRLNYWITALIISTSLVMLLSLILINKQLAKVKSQNAQLKEIAWIQSHKVRAQIANLLGLGQLLNRNDTADNDVVVAHMLATTLKLDEIVREINDKSSCES